MKPTTHTHWLTALLLCITLLYAIGCSNNNPSGPSDDGNSDNQVNQKVQTVSANSVDIYNTVSSFQQISTLLLGPESMVDLEVPEVENPQQAMSFARSVLQQSFDKIKSDSDLLTKTQGTLADSVIWDVTYRDDVLGITYRSSLIYDSETSKGRLFLVRFDFPESHPLTYDSTEIKVDLNFTIFYGADDVLISLENLKRFKPRHLIQEEFGSFVPDPYAPGTEPTGGTLESNITYSPSSFISSTHAILEYHEGSGGSYSKEVQFSDGSSSSVSVTFREDGTGTFSETRRDGTQIEGTFDSPENDGVGSFTKTTTFPEGHDPVSIFESGEFTFNPVDSTLHGAFEKEVRFKDGTVERENVTVDQTVVGNVKTTTINVEKTDGGSGFITIVESPEVDQISGEWTNPDETFLIFSAESYPDGSAHFEFELYASKAAYENGEDPIASGEFDFYPDGSGQGTVTVGGQTYEVTINPDGTVTVKDNSGSMSKLNLWH
ncbi:MAG: hypothetical protein ACE5IW_01515 [bacterium]